MAKDCKSGKILRFDELYSYYYIIILRFPQYTNDVPKLIEYFFTEFLIEISEVELYKLMEPTDVDEETDLRTLLRDVYTG